MNGIEIPARYETFDQLKQAIKHEWESNDNLRNKIHYDANFDDIEEFLTQAHSELRGHKELSAHEYKGKSWEWNAAFVSNIGTSLEELGYLTRVAYPGILHEQGSGERTFYCLADLDSLDNYEHSTPDRSIGEQMN